MSRRSTWAEQVQQRGQRGEKFLVVQTDTGEAREAHRVFPGGGRRAQHIRLMRAFVLHAGSQGRKVWMWTLGTSAQGFEGAEAVRKWISLFGRWLTKTMGRRYIFVMEAGTKGKRWHLHALIEGELSQAAAKAEWRRITRIADPHVMFGRWDKLTQRMVPEPVDEGAAYYLAKYLSKGPVSSSSGSSLESSAAVDSSLIEGFQRFASSNHLTRQVAAFLPEAKPQQLWRVEEAGWDGRSEVQASA